MADAWADDLDAGHDSALLAWRRADVADLNRLARAPLGPDSATSTATTSTSRADAVRRRRPGRRPRPEPRPPGSSPANALTITGDRRPNAIDARTGDGRDVTLTGDGIDAEHLDHGYAAHRAPRPRRHLDRAHVFAAGGGRELAYVALGRARHHTTIHAAADDLAQAVDDLHSRLEPSTATNAGSPTPPPSPDTTPNHRKDLRRS